MDCSPRFYSWATAAIERSESITRCAAGTVNSAVNFLRFNILNILPAGASRAHDWWIFAPVFVLGLFSGFMAWWTGYAPTGWTM